MKKINSQSSVTCSCPGVCAFAGRLRRQRRASAGTAASGSAPASGSEPTAPADPTTLKVYTWWDVTKFEHLQKMQQDFEAANPDIKLEFVTIPSKYADTMVTKLAGGEIPDVMMLAMDQVPRYALNGMLLPLDDLASQEYKDALYPVVKDALTVNGTMYAAARDVTPKVMYLNTKMFEDAGIEIPADDLDDGRVRRDRQAAHQGQRRGRPVGLLLEELYRPDLRHDRGVRR